MQDNTNTTISDKKSSGRTAAQRRKRINRLKMIIIVFIVILFMIPTIYCIILSSRINKLQYQIQELINIHNGSDLSEGQAEQDGMYASSAGQAARENETPDQSSVDTRKNNQSGDKLLDNGSTKEVYTSEVSKDEENPLSGTDSVTQSPAEDAKKAAAETENSNFSLTSNPGKNLTGRSGKYVSPNTEINIQNYLNEIQYPDQKIISDKGDITIQAAEVLMNSVTDNTAGSGSLPPENSDGSLIEEGKTESSLSKESNLNIGSNPNKESMVIKDGDASLSEKLQDKVDLPDAKKKNEIKIASTEKQIYAGKKVYLTFDDGPSENTDKILDILAEYKVKATFFVIGKTDNESKRRYNRIIEEGHTLGMHSYSHVYNKIYNSIEDFDKDFTKLWKLLYDTTGYKPTIYRFPGGSMNLKYRKSAEDFINYLNDKSIVYYDWNVLNGDATGKTYTQDQLIDNVLSGVAIKKTSIVLMHDTQTKDTTVASLPKLLENLISGGAQLLPLDAGVSPIQQINLSSIEK